MNRLLFEMKRSLVELDLGLKGDLGMSDAMETLMNALYDDRVPASWNKVAYPSMRGLASWLSDMLGRQRQLEAWTADLSTPKVTWVPGLFNPQAFLTAVMQTIARKNELPLDRMTTVFDVSKKASPDEIEAATREGAYIHGLYVEGARWDMEQQLLAESKPKTLFEVAPVLWLKPTKTEELAPPPYYDCPVYKTGDRRGVLATTGHSTNFVMFLKFPSDVEQDHWIQRGVACLTQLND